MPRTPLDTAEQLACADVLHSRFTALPGSATIEDVRAWSRAPGATSSKVAGRAASST
jgi:hypothetical protein